MLRRVFLILLCLVLAVVTLGGGLLGFLAWSPDTLKPLVERVASAQLGREVRIDGPIRISPGRISTVEIHGLRVAAPEWAAADNLAEIQRVKVGLDLAGYVRERSLHLTEVEVEAPRVALERDAQGRTSWPEATEPEPAEADEPGPTGLPRIDALTVAGGHIDYRDAIADVQFAADVATRPIDGGSTPSLVVEGSGTLRGDPIEVALQVGTSALAGEGGGPLPLDGRAVLAGTAVTLSGEVRDPAALDGIDLALDVTSEDPRPLLELAGRPVEAELPPFEAHARLLRGEGAFELDELRASWGASRLEGRLSYDPTAQPPQIRGRLMAPMLDLVPVWPVLTAGEEEPPSMENPLSALAGYDVDLEIGTGEVRLPQLTLAETAARARIADDRLTVEPLRVRLPAGEIGGRVATGPFQEPLEAELALEAQGVDLGQTVRLDGPVAGIVNGSLTGTLRGTEPMAILERSQLRFDGRAEGLSIPQADLGTIAAELQLEKGRVVADPLRADLPQGRVAGRAAAGPFGQGFTADLDLTAENVDLGAIARSEAFAGVLNADVEGTLNGSTPAELLTRSRLELRGEVDQLRLPQIEEGVPRATLVATLDPERDTAFRLVAEGQAGDLPLRLAAWGASAERLAANEGDYPVTLELDAGQNRARVNGTVTLPLALGSTMRAEILAEGPDPAPVLALFKLPKLELPPYRIAGTVINERTTLRIVGLDGRVGDSDIGGDLTVTLEGDRPAIAGELRSSLIDIDDFGGLIGAQPGTGEGETASAGQEAAAVEEAQDGEVIPDEPLEPSRWRMVDVDLDVNAEEVRAGRVPLDGLSGSILLDDGLLRLDPLTVRVGQGRIEGNVELDGREAPIQADLAIDLRRLSVARLLNRLDVDIGAFGTLSGSARGGIGVAGEGLSVKEILADANGEATLVMEGGSVDGRIVTALGFDLLGLLGRVLNVTSQEVELSCTLADLAVNDGIVTTRSLVIDTPVAELGGDGTINLETEEIDITLLSRPKTTVAVPVERTGITIGGTLAEPAVQINPAELAVRGAAAATLGVLVKPFATILGGLGEGQQGGTTPCADALAELEEP